MFRLYQQGMLASLAPPGSPTVDVLVLAPDETVVASLQVKTRSYGRVKGWHMKEKHELIVQKRYFYAFVDLEPESPVTYIVPSRFVARALKRGHQAWVDAPGKGGRPHKAESAFRWLAPDYSPLDVPGHRGRWLERYRERWDLLREQVQARGR